MAHCGFEGTAVNDAFSHPFKALFASIRGPRVEGALAPELPILYSDNARVPTVASIPVAQVQRMRRETEETAVEHR
jgi:hypothetical protein